MFYKQILMDDKGCLSYIIGCTEAKTACVVNPRKGDVGKYLSLANKSGMKITHIFETPSHVGNLSGKIELKFRTDADIYFLEETEKPNFYKLAKEGDVFEFGNATLKIINSPMHLPFGNSILVTDKSKENEPWIVLTRESIFIGDLAKQNISSEELSKELTHYLDFHGTAQTLPSLQELQIGSAMKQMSIAV